MDLVAAVKEVVGAAGVDVVFDPVGGAAYDASTKVIAFEGRIVVVGFTCGTIPAPALGHALVKNYSIVGLHWGLYLQRDHAVADDAHAVLSRWVAQGLVRPAVSERVPFAEAADALTRLAAGADDRTRRRRAGRRLTGSTCAGETTEAAGRPTCAPELEAARRRR